VNPARTFFDLIVWQKAHRYVLQVYEYTGHFPNSELFGLASQHRKAAISIAANIAEGFKKRGKKDKGRFLNIAQGSLEECRYYQILAKDLNYGDTNYLNEQLEEVSRLLTAYHSAIIKSDVTSFRHFLL
jgi:four helix bundle protein